MLALMKDVWHIVVLLYLVSVPGFGATGASAYAFDPEVRSLSRVGMVNFGGMGMYRSISAGESLLRRIMRKDEALKCMMEVYNTGTPAAKVYALAYFHHSAPELFQICWDDLVGKYNPVVKSAAGCFLMEGSFLEHMIRIRLGEYDPHVELAVSLAEKSGRK